MLRRIHPVLLASLCKQVVALDVRPRNVPATLARLFIHNVSNATVALKDVRDLDESFGQFDILFHSGVLYHLMNPVEHLVTVSRIAPEMMLDTHYADDNTDLTIDDITFGSKTYRAYLYQEYGGGGGPAFRCRGAIALAAS
jgi:tRNA (mo5U34)-methyltransferase